MNNTNVFDILSQPLMHTLTEGNDHLPTRCLMIVKGIILFHSAKESLLVVMSLSTQVVHLVCALMFQLQEALHFRHWISKESFKVFTGKTHGNDVIGDVFVAAVLAYRIHMAQMKKKTTYNSNPNRIHCHGPENVSSSLTPIFSE